MKRVTAVDAFKLLFSYCVVAIHTQLFSALNCFIVLEMLISMAVPIFFICSGYFFQVKINRNSSKEYRGGCAYGVRLFKPYIIWGSWYFMLEIANNVIIDNMPLAETVSMLLHRWLLRSPGCGLWYVQAILYMLAILWLLNNRRGSYGGMTVILTVTFLSARIIGTNLTELSTAMFSKEYYSLNFLCNGIYFLLGIGLARYMARKNVTSQKAIWYFVALIAVQTMMYIIKADDSSSLQTILLSILTICAMVLLFLFAYRWTLPIKRETSERLRKMGSIIYFLHFTAIYGVKVADRLIGVTLSPVWLCGLSAVLLTIIAAILSTPRWNRLSSKLF